MATTTVSGKARARRATQQVAEQAGAAGHVLAPGLVPRRPWRTDLVDPVLSFVVYGIPAAQGSKAFRGMRGGKPILSEVSDRVDPWREQVRAMARQATRDHAKHTGARWTALDEPVMVSAVVTVPATKASASRGDVYASGTPDLDKMERAIGDALAPVPLSPSEGKGLPESTRAKVRDTLMEQRRAVSVLHDDSRIVVWDHVAKVYPATTVDSLAFSGVTIQIWRMADLDAAAAKPLLRHDGRTWMRAGDLWAWGRPQTGETWPAASGRLWADPTLVLAHTGVITLRGRGLDDVSVRGVLRALTLHGPEHLLEVVEEAPAARAA